VDESQVYTQPDVSMTDETEQQQQQQPAPVQSSPSVPAVDPSSAAPINSTSTSAPTFTDSLAAQAGSQMEDTVATQPNNGDETMNDAMQQ